ncbi:hypothetical protein MKEN_00297500 [Mycena kentingensis (nom. inval.)]|nr:hypothetical protein MKEN_00297500 [Mycena kentingensis (nom. inval.)]
MRLEQRSFDCPDFDADGGELQHQVDIIVQGVTIASCVYEDEACQYSEDGDFMSGPDACPHSGQNDPPAQPPPHTVTKTAVQTITGGPDPPPTSSETSESPSTPVPSPSSITSLSTFVAPSSSSEYSSHTTSLIMQTSLTYSASEESPPPTSATELTSTSTSTHHLSTGSIGGIVAGSLTLSLLALLLFCFRQRRHTRVASNAKVDVEDVDASHSSARFPRLRTRCSPGTRSQSAVSPFTTASADTTSERSGSGPAPPSTTISLPRQLSHGARLRSDLRALRKELESTQGRETQQAAQNDALRARVRLLEVALAAQTELPAPECHHNQSEPPQYTYTPPAPGPWPAGPTPTS